MLFRSKLIRARYQAAGHHDAGSVRKRDGVHHGCRRINQRRASPACDGAGRKCDADARGFSTCQRSRAVTRGLQAQRVLRDGRSSSDRRRSCHWLSVFDLGNFPEEQHRQKRPPPTRVLAGAPVQAPRDRAPPPPCLPSPISSPWSASAARHRCRCSGPRSAAT